MLKVYPAIIHNEDNSYWVEFPDLEGCQTCGCTLEETMEFAQEALGLYLVAVSEDGHELPTPSDLSTIPTPDGGITSYISSNIEQYRKNTKAVKKTVSIPAWLAEEAEKTNISLSKVLQDGLKERLETR